MYTISPILKLQCHRPPDVMHAGSRKYYKRETINSEVFLKTLMKKLLNFKHWKQYIIIIIL